MNQINIYSLPNLIVGLLVLYIGLNIQRNNNLTFTKYFFYLCLSSGFWQIFYGISYLFNDINVSKILLRLGFSCVTFISITYFIFTINFLYNISLKIIKNILIIYGFFAVFLILFTNYIIQDVKLYFWGYYPIAGQFYIIYLFIFLLLINISLSLLLYTYFYKRNISKIRKQQIKYVLIALTIYSFACIDFLPNLGITVYPFGYIPTFLFILLISYCAFRYNLMNIKIAIAKTTIFIIIYSIVLLIPYLITLNYQTVLINKFNKQWILFPLLISTILAIIAPYVYIKISKKAEYKILLKQQIFKNKIINMLKKIQNIHNINMLIKYVENSLIKILNTNFVKITSYNELDEIIKSYVANNKEIIIIDIIKQKSYDTNNIKLSNLYKYLNKLKYQIVIPIYINNNQVVAVLVLGESKTNDLNLGSLENLEILTVLQTQLSLAFENALFYEEVKKTHQQLLKAEKMATIGIMADGLSHQINNRLHALNFITSDMLDTIRIKENEFRNSNLIQLKQELEDSLTRIEKNIKQCGEIVRGLLKYSRNKPNHNFDTINIKEVLDATLEMIKFKIKPGSIKIINNLPDNGVQVMGNFTELQEVFFNIIDNAYDALMQKLSEEPSNDYQPTLTIESNYLSDNEIEIKFTDNGIGIKNEDRDKLFTPFFSTKLTSQKGTGLGLFVIQKIIEEHHQGRVIYRSEYKKGTTVILILKKAKESNKVNNENE